MASTYLQRTETSGNRRTYTFSAWIKKASNSHSPNYLTIFDSHSTPYQSFSFRDGNDLQWFNSTGGQLITNQVFRDTSAFYHLVLSVDTTQATEADRVKIYVNGDQVTSFSTATYPAQNADLNINNSQTMYIGVYNGSSDHFDGVMTHVNFIDGTAYDADTFGQTETASGIWKPKTSPSVTYGTNGFFLKFGNSGSLGTDSSGNGNNFTLSGSGTQTLDTPSNVFATINPLANGPGIGSISNGNLTTYNANVYETSLATLGFSTGKWYWELKNVTQVSYTEIVGVANEQCDLSNNLGATADGWSYFIQSNSDNGNSFNNNTRPASPYTTSSQGDIISVAVDADAGKIWFGINGTWVNSGDPAAGTGFIFDNLTTNGFYFPAHTAYDGPSSGNPLLSYNFGNGYFGTTAVASANNDSAGLGQFEYAVPSGYYALCTKNIAEYG